MALSNGSAAIEAGQRYRSRRRGVTWRVFAARGRYYHLWPVDAATPVGTAGGVKAIARTEAELLDKRKWERV